MLKQYALVAGRVLLFWLATMVVLAISGSIVGQTRNTAVATGAITVPITFAITLLFVRWEGARPTGFGFSTDRTTWIRFVVGASLGFLLIGAQTAIIWLAGGVQWTPAIPAPTIFLPIVGYLLLASREELAFRGYSFRLLASKANPLVAQAVMATLFTLEHRLAGATWENALLGAGVGSLVFGMAALAGQGLALPIGLHAAWNIGDWARGGKGDAGLWRMVVDPSSAAHVGTVAMTSYVGVMMCAFLGLWLWQRGFGDRAPWWQLSTHLEH